MEKHYIYIGIGTNLEDGDAVLQWAKCQLMETFGGEQRYSTPQRTEPVDFPFPHLFTNQVVFIETTVSPTLIRPLLKGLEFQFGRRPEDKARGLVRLDLDLLCLDGQVLKVKDWKRTDVLAARSELS